MILHLNQKGAVNAVRYLTDFQSPAWESLTTVNKNY